MRGWRETMQNAGNSHFHGNALAETVIGLYKTELIRQQGPWRNLEAVEFATVELGGLVQQPTSAPTKRRSAICGEREPVFATTGRVG